MRFCRLCLALSSDEKVYETSRDWLLSYKDIFPSTSASSLFLFSFSECSIPISQAVLHDRPERFIRFSALQSSRSIPRSTQWQPHADLEHALVKEENSKNMTCRSVRVSARDTRGIIMPVYCRLPEFVNIPVATRHFSFRCNPNNQLLTEGKVSLRGAV